MTLALDAIVPAGVAQRATAARANAALIGFRTNGGRIFPRPFIASLAQFTPKAVETQSEREKLMFRIRVRIDPERPRQRSGIVRSGLPGVAYVKADRTARWPEWLQGATG